jgi:hypothetical protein
MRPILVVIVDKLVQHRRRLLLIEHDHVVRTFSAEGPDHTFGNCVCTRRSNGCSDGIHTDPPGPPAEGAAIDRSVIVQQMARLVAHGVASISWRHTQAAVGSR